MNNKPLTNEVGEVRELTEEDFAKARPLVDVFPELVKAQQKGQLKVKSMGRPKSLSPKQATSIRLSPEVLSYFRDTGKGWQTRMGDVLKKYVQNHQA